MPSNEWLGYTRDPGSVDVYDHRLTVGMNHPLEPGTYYVGVLAEGSGTSSYTLESRAIGSAGSGLGIEVQEVAFAGGSLNITDLAPRELVYAKVSVPEGAASMQMKLSPSVGELAMVKYSGALPNIFHNGGTIMQKAGKEYYHLLPSNGQATLPAGDHYFAIFSEGVAPVGSTIGSGNVTGVFESVGELAVTDLGLASASPMTRSLSLEGGEIQAYQFEVPAGTSSLEVRLDNRAGDPGFSILEGTGLPAPYHRNSYGSNDSYGQEGGHTRDGYEFDAYTISNPTPGIYTLNVRAYRDSGTSHPVAATADLVIRTLSNLPLNFAASMNGNGESHSVSATLLDGQRRFYEVAVPADLDGDEIIGWKLEVAHAQGDTTLRVFPDFQNPLSDYQSITADTAFIVPPYLTLGSSWFVEVLGNGITDYTLTSSPVTLERPAWSMPTDYNLTFGDSGEGLPGDQGIDLGEDDWHFYAVDVPDGNGGLLQTELQAINGDPELFIGERGLPGLGYDGARYGPDSIRTDHQMSGVGSEIGNWVPASGRTEHQLKPGRWYFAVRADGSNSRYRLLISTGDVQDLALDGGLLTGQALKGGDWRYYRVQIPEDAPDTWTLNFTQQIGDVVMHVRDSIPPGQRDYISTNSSYLWNASDDSKNSGASYFRDGRNTEGSYDITTPTLRPGHTYFVGFRAAVDSEFSVSSSVSSGSLGTLPELDYATGLADLTLAAGETATYLVRVPADASRWKHTSVRSSSVEIRIENGSIPSPVGSSVHYSNSSANGSYNRSMYGWPWVADEVYYVSLVNKGASDEPVQFQMDGRTILTEDEDNDGLADYWEDLHFGSRYTYDGDDDPDQDGNDNETEETDGTDPNDATSILPRLYVTNLGGGSVVVSPDKVSYTYGESVTLTATPDAGNTVRGWSGDVAGADAVLNLTMDRTYHVTVAFGVPLAPAVEGEGFAFTTGGDAEWFHQEIESQVDGDALQSGDITDGDETWLETTVNGPGTLRFLWKVSSEGGYDRLRFRLNGSEQFNISGTVGWEQREVVIADEGQHTLHWTYTKDGSVSSGSDAGWVDGFEWIPAGSGGFASAAMAAGLTGNDALPDATPFDDGVANLLKFAFNMNLAGRDSRAMAPGGTAGLPAGRLVEQGGQSYWRVEYVERIGSGLIYTPQKSTTLGAGSFVPLTATPVVTPIDADWQRVTYDEPCDPSVTPRCFSRVEVVEP